MTQLVIDQELAAAGVERPDLKIGGWAAPTILGHGNDAQRERFVRPTLLGELTWCQLFSEPGAGSDLASLRTRAQRVDGGWRLTGQKVWTSLAHEADWGICLARTDPDAPPHQGISYFLVDMRGDGIDVRPLRELTGDAHVQRGVPRRRLRARRLRGGRAGRRLEAGPHHPRQRAGRDGREQARRQHRARRRAGRGRLAGRTGPGGAGRWRWRRSAALLGVRSTLRSLAGQGPGAESSVAKLLGVRSRQESSELVVELHGSRAVVPDDEVRADVHEMLLTRCLSIAGGTTQILRNVAAERILGLPR